jgi:hypothetical protein
MKSARLSRSLSLVLVICLALLAFPFSASANHAWGNYHWARTQNPFNLRLGDNVTSNWDSYLRTASSDWSKSTVLDTTVVAGGTTSKRCRPTTGRVEVCNSKYGNNGWLGVAQIWASGSHITQGTVKMNDTYFNTAQYNTPAWRTMVMCQEVGHTFGLDHQDENFDNTPLGTCMDYTSDPTPNQHPNAHDYEELQIIYSHLDSSTTVGGMPAEVANGDFSALADWGKAIHHSADGRASLYMREFAGGHRIFTFVFWAEGRGR